MKRLSTKRAALERDYSKSLKNKMENRDTYGCDGCGKNVPVTPSHLIPRSYDITLLADIDNFHFHCHKCAALCEAGEYPRLKDGKEIAEYIKETRPDYWEIKRLAYLNRHKTDLNDLL